MDKRIGISLLLASAIFGLFAPLAFALPTADNFGVSDVSGGNQGTYILVPVNITNAQNGPIVSVRFDTLYDNSVINVVGAQKGDLTSLWDSPISNNLPWGTRVAMVYDGKDEHAIQNCSSGSVVLLKFSIIGEPGETSRMDFAGIQLADTGYKQSGTALAKNGTFSILSELSGPTHAPALIHSPPATEPPAVESDGAEGLITPSDTEYKAPTSTPKPPGFNTISAIAGLIAVSYLSLWRRKA
uniref:Cohesin domain-containing protein n=1 Tax=Candidatus Methanophaga sp. ANME-1 ERB7 TaxID=2759913 RepID=A0A7G9Z8Z4_9EURY|nr:hypothetical protein HGIILDEE_00017 [Methanosarcinales archaeon ANME-1 ERB7]